ncbi:MAG: hypothetical protein KatS3mg061_0795 [Dehalococcoidia bacterium]|nr:MAG: hypothetical protein KatS3mg061_0795 [Dehalococcoidia bacterium]
MHLGRWPVQARRIGDTLRGLLPAERVSWRLLWRYRRLGAELGWLAVGQVLTVLGSLVSVRVVTELLTPEANGEFALATTLAGFAQLPTLSPLANAALRYFAPAQERGTVPQFLRLVGQQVALLALGIGGVGLIAAALTAQLAGAPWPTLCVGAALLAIVGGTSGVLSALQNAARQRAVVALHAALAKWLTIAALVVLVYQFGSAGTVALGATVLASGLVMLSQAGFLLPLFRRREHAPAASGRPVTARELLRYAFPFTLIALPSWVQLFSDRWALQLFGTTADVGRFTVLVALGVTPLNLAFNLLAQFVEPLLYARAGDGTDPARLRSALRATLLVLLLYGAGLLVLVLGAALLSGFIFSLLVAPAYREVAPLLPLAVLAGGMFNLGQLASILPLQFTESRALLAPKLGSGILTLLFNLAGSALLGTTGVLVASILASTIYCLWMGGITYQLALRSRARAHSSAEVVSFRSG